MTTLGELSLTRYAAGGSILNLLPPFMDQQLNLSCQEILEILLLSRSTRRWQQISARASSTL